MAEIPNRPEYQSDLFKQGLAVRKEVLGADYVQASLEKADDFFAAFQQITTEVPWGQIWTRPGLGRRDRGLIVLAMLAAMSKPAELKLHVRGALTNGVTREEIKEILLQACIYAGIPAGLEAFKAAVETFRELDAKTA
jgi:4-carboxymuconolactone decarboxylase